jgi:hypothetical protein
MEPPMTRARLLVLLTLLVLFVQPAAASGTTALVVSQVYGGGGNAGAPYANDYVELFNSGTTPVSVAGWSVQYATAAGTSWSATPLTGIVQPGKYYLVQLAGGTVGNALPAPDATGTTNLSATSGKIALVRDTADLTCGATAGSCSAAALVEDLIGFGTAGDYEGSGAAPALSSTTAAIRGGSGCSDTDANAADFAAAAPAPRNSASAAHACSTTPPAGPSATQTAAVEVQVEAALSLSLEKATLNFGTTTAGAAPAPVSERVTVLSNHPAGYALTVHRSAFAPADLPLALQATAPSGGTLGSALAGGALAPVPIGPSVLTIGQTSAISAPSGDVWPTNVGFAAPFPTVAPGRYTATVTFTVIGR